MKTVLHILTRSDDPSPMALIEEQKGHAELQVRVVDFTVPNPDYTRAIDEVFAAESIMVW